MQLQYFWIDQTVCWLQFYSATTEIHRYCLKRNQVVLSRFTRQMRGLFVLMILSCLIQCGNENFFHFLTKVVFVFVFVFNSTCHLPLTPTQRESSKEQPCDTYSNYLSHVQVCMTSFGQELDISLLIIHFIQKLTMLITLFLKRAQILSNKSLGFFQVLFCWAQPFHKLGEVEL